MEAWQIILLILVILVFLYLGLLVYVMSMVAHFSGRLKKRLVAISVLFSEKKGILQAIGAEFKKANLKLTLADNAAVINLDSIAASAIKEGDVIPTSAKLKEIQKRFNFIAETNSWEDSTGDYRSLTASLHDLDANYRQSIALYNSDATAYNYWIHTPLFKWLAWLFGHRSKEPLN